MVAQLHFEAVFRALDTGNQLALGAGKPFGIAKENILAALAVALRASRVRLGAMTEAEAAGTIGERRGFLAALGGPLGRVASLGVLPGLPLVLMPDAPAIAAIHAPHVHDFGSVGRSECEIFAQDRGGLDGRLLRYTLHLFFDQALNSSIA